MAGAIVTEAGNATDFSDVGNRRIRRNCSIATDTGAMVNAGRAEQAENQRPDHR